MKHSDYKSIFFRTEKDPIIDCRNISKKIRFSNFSLISFKEKAEYKEIMLVLKRGTRNTIF